MELIRAFRGAYERLGLAGKVIATDHDPLAPALRAADRACLVPLMSSPEYIPSLRKICRDEGVRLIFPLSIRILPYLRPIATSSRRTGRGWLPFPWKRPSRRLTSGRPWPYFAGSD